MTTDTVTTDTLFLEAMTHLASGVAVITALDWSWDGDVPQLGATLAYLRCTRTDSFVKYDHTILIGDLEGGRLEQGEPLVYARRRMDWLMQPMES